MNKSRFLALALIAVSAASLASCDKPAPAPRTVSVVRAQSGSVPYSETELAVVDGATVADLSFRAVGTVRELLVREGDRVRAGQLLARLGDAGGTARSVQSAQAAASVAAGQLSISRSDADGGTRAATSAAQAAQARAAQARESLDAAGRSLESLRASFSVRRGNLVGSIPEAASRAASAATDAAEFLDVLLGITDARRNLNDGFERFLGAKDSAKLPAAQAATRAYLTEYAAAFPGGASPASSPADLAAPAKALASARAALLSARALLDASVAGGDAFPESDLSARKASASSLLAAVDRALSDGNGGGLKGISQALAQLAADESLQLRQAQDAVTAAGKGVAAAEASAGSAAGSADKDSAALASAVAVQRDALRMAQIAAAEAREAAEIRAPFDGVVTRRLLDPGATASPGSPVLTVATDGRRVARAHFSAARLALSVGAPAAVRDLAGNLLGTGAVSLLDRSADPATGKRLVEVSLGTTFPAAIGDRVSVTLSAPDLDRSTVLLPASALVDRFGVPQVFLAGSGSVRLVHVEIAGRSDGSVAVRGVASGASVVAAGVADLFDGDAAVPVEK